ncbi:MAG: pilus assembly protein TadG-related protein [Myxococcaceae bacterium]
MLTRVLRQSMKRQEGQALVLAALVVLVLSIAVITTVNLGHTVHERIRLQNTSDAAAYSMAAMEARAFNFYAFANRTQVSHYVSAMVWQSILSFIYFAEAFVTDVYGVMKSIDQCANASGILKAVCTALEALPYIGQALKAVNALIQAMRGLVTIVQNIIKGANPDFLIGKLIVPGHRWLNAALGGMSTAVMVGAMTHDTSTSNTVIEANDSNVDSAATRLLTGVLSGCIFNRAHMKEANGDFISPVINPVSSIDVTAVQDSSKESRAKRAMGAISNASRFPCDPAGTSGGWCPPGWVTSRTPGDILPLPSWLGFARGLLNAIQWKWGQTKMLTFGQAVGGPWDPRGNGQGNFIRDWKDLRNVPIGMMAQGDNIGADDLYSINIGPSSIVGIKNPFACDEDEKPEKCWGDNRKGKYDSSSRKLPFRAMLKTSVWALNDQEKAGGSNRVRGGIHYRLAYPSGPRDPGWRGPNGPRNERDIGLNEYKKCLGVEGPFGICAGVKLPIYIANVRGIQDGNHPWDGVVHFPHFEPGQYDAACGQSIGGSAPSSSVAASRNTEGSRQGEFNQPSTWVMLRKNASQMRNPLSDPTGAGTNKPALLNDSGGFKFAFSGQGSQLTLENTRKKFLGMEGLNVVSRGQTYYHRPGNWTEQPNFFNPYWRPRLASVWQGRYSLPFINTAANALPGVIKNIPQKIMTH